MQDRTQRTLIAVVLATLLVVAVSCGPSGPPSWEKTEVQRLLASASGYAGEMAVEYEAVATPATLAAVEVADARARSLVLEAVKALEERRPTFKDYNRKVLPAIRETRNLYSVLAVATEWERELASAPPPAGMSLDFFKGKVAARVMTRHAVSLEEARRIMQNFELPDNPESSGR